MITAVLFWSLLFGNSKSCLSAATSFEDGTFIVGKDILPGTYRSEGGGMCYWARLSGFGGDLSDVIANGTMTKRPIVTIKKTDKGFETRNCGTWHRISN